MTDAFHAPPLAVRFHDEWRRQMHDALYDYARTYITRDAWTYMEETMNEVRAMTAPISDHCSHLFCRYLLRLCTQSQNTNRLYFSGPSTRSLIFSVVTNTTHHPSTKKRLRHLETSVIFFWNVYN
jgi:hypothetical protein